MAKMKEPMQTIELTQGKVAIVDDWNFEWLNQFKWYAWRNRNRWYAARNVLLSNGKRTKHYMHRVIVGNPTSMEIDHKDREATLDNREDNLRVTAGQNQQNVGLRNDNKSGFKGVSWCKRKRKWHVAIEANKQSIYLGDFNTAIEGAAVWNFAAKRLHGEFAVLNDLSQV
jgi:hypothetical protein